MNTCQRARTTLQMLTFMKCPKQRKVWRQQIGPRHNISQKLSTTRQNILSQHEQVLLAALLSEHEDVFARDQFDLGTFTKIEHGIQTEQAPPVKQHMRRTPACFVNEDEAHLKKMLDAGMIQESMSEWASSPVLIRKRNGTVRWCIDYRQLNNVTIKDVFALPLVDDCLDT